MMLPQKPSRVRKGRLDAPCATRRVEEAEEIIVQDVCGNGLVETGETCDDGNALTELCSYVMLRRYGS